MKKLIAAACMTVLSAIAFAQPGPGMGQPGPCAGVCEGSGPCKGERPMHERKDMMAKLNLTEDQRAQVQKIRFDLQKKQTALQSKIKIARLEIQELFAAASPDKGAIEKKMKEVSDLQLQEKLNGLDHMFAVKAILTPEQQKTWKMHMKAGGPEMPGRMMERKMGRKG